MGSLDSLSFSQHHRERKISLDWLPQPTVHEDLLSRRLPRLVWGVIVDKKEWYNQYAATSIDPPCTTVFQCEFEGF